MNILRAICVAVAFVAITSVLGCVGDHANKSDITTVARDIYSVEYKLASNDKLFVEATIKGPADKLAVILFDPNGQTNIEIIEKDQMISNSQTVRLSVKDPQAGTYVLTVKTVDPEKTVCQDSIVIPPSQLTVDEVKIDLLPPDNVIPGFILKGFYVVLKKDGILPVGLIDFSATLDDEKCGSPGISSEGSPTDRQSTLSASFYQPSGVKSGEHHVVKGTLFYGKDRRSLNFEKEFVIPEKGTQTAKL